MKRVLVIDGDDQGHFCLSVTEGALTLGENSDHADVSLRDLHILRIHCEIEVDDDRIVVTAPATSSAVGEPSVQELHPGQELRIGPARLRLEHADEDAEEAASSLDEKLPAVSAPTPLPTALVGASATAAPTTAPRKQLLVIDGADQKQAFRLPHAGSVTIGNTGRNADIGLHDFYVSGVHCRLDIQGDKVLVSHNEGKNGTLINGQRINQQQELRLGDVLRVGNSHLRLELAEGGEHHAPRAGRLGGDVHSQPPDGQQVGHPRCRAGFRGAKCPGDAGERARGYGEGDALRSLEGQVLGHYRLGSLLGSGHSGQVFRAEDIKANQLVALKVLAPEFPASAVELQQFAQALKVATPLRHPNLVGLFGAGKNGPHCWIAREYVDGESADRLVRRVKDEGKLSWMRGLRIAVHLAKALAFLHEHKVVHGNITPQNILVSREDKTTKLADLMLAKALHGSRLQMTFLEKKLLSELPYMAPEQVKPDAFVDYLADLYAVGAVVYLLITGEPPFAGSTPEKVIARIQEAPVVKPSRYQPKIPFPFEGVVLKLLAKHQEDRYQTAAELLTDLEVLAHHHDIKV